jgi:hypothetical protein
MWAGFLADIKALNEKLLVVEHLSLAGATSYMQNHYIAAKGIPLFPGFQGMRGHIYQEARSQVGTCLGWLGSRG